MNHYQLKKKVKHFVLFINGDMYSNLASLRVQLNNIYGWLFVS